MAMDTSAQDPGREDHPGDSQAETVLVTGPVEEGSLERRKRIPSEAPSSSPAPTPAPTEPPAGS